LAKKNAFKEKDYLAVAKKKVYRAGDKPFNPKFLIYGRKKAGKSTFALSAGAERTLVLDPEGGVDYKTTTRPYIWPCEVWEDVDAAYGALRTGKLSPKLLGQGKEDRPFRVVVVDGLTKFNNLALRFIMNLAEETNLDRKPGIVDRRDYNKSGELMKQMVGNFHTLPMVVVYTSQERMLTAGWDDEADDSDEEAVQYVPDLPQGVRGHVNALVDVIARVYAVKNDEGETERRLHIGVSPSYDTGVRSEFVLPDKMTGNPTLLQLMQAMKKGQS
jgi:hypothetical protein